MVRHPSDKAINPAVSIAIKHLIPIDAENDKNGTNMICKRDSGESVAKIPSIVHMAPDAPNDEPILLAFTLYMWQKKEVITDDTLYMWLKKEVITDEDIYSPTNCSFPSAATIGPINECNTNILHPR